MAMDLQYLRDYVRKFLDLAQEDLDDLLIDRWAEEGVTKIQKAARRWPFYQTRAELLTVADTSSYARPMRHVEQVIDQWGRQLEYLDYHEASRRFRSNGNTGVPLAYSIFGDQIILSPTPDGPHTLELWGYRDGLPLGVAAGAIPDLPSEFHEALLNWVMARAMEHQEDPEMSQLHEARFEKLLATLSVEELSAPTARPTIMGGGKGLARRNTVGELSAPRMPFWDV